MDIFFLLAALPTPFIPVFIQIFRRRQERKRYENPEEPPEDRPGISEGLPVLDSSSVKARLRVTDEMERVVGNISIPDSREIKHSMVVHGDLTMGSKCHVYGSLSVFGEVEVGEESIVEGHILAENRISIGGNVKVGGIVDSVEDVAIAENTTAEAVCTEKSVTLASGAKINRKVLAGKSLLTALSLLKEMKAELAAEEEREEPQGEIPQPTVSPFFDENETRETFTDKSRLFEILKEYIERLDSSRGQGIDYSVLKKLTSWLRLLIDPTQVQEILDSLIERQLKESSVEDVFETMLASKLRPEIKEKIEKRAEEREMMTSLLHQLPERPSPQKLEIVEEEGLKEEIEAVEARPRALTGFPMKVFGEIFHAGDGVTAVVGDVEIPDRSIVDKPLVIKGKVKIGSDCRILRNLKALGEISIGDRCSVKANVSSGDSIALGRNTVIEGEVHAESSLKLSEGTEIHGLVEAGGAYVTAEELTPEDLSRGEKENGEHNH